MSLYAHFQRRVANAGLVLGSPRHAGLFRGYAAARDTAVRQLRADGFYYGGDFQVDSVQPRTYHRDGAEAVETRDQAIARAVKKAQFDALVPQASQALTYFFQQIYQIRHRALTAWDGGYLPIDTQVDRAANDYVWYERDLQGLARAETTYNPDKIPLVSGPSGSANRGRIVPALCGFETNFMDDRRSALARANGKPDFKIEQGKLETCHRVLAEFFNALWLWGDSQLAITGLMNEPNIQTVALPNGDWANATGLQIKDDLTFMLDFIAQQSIGDLADKRKLRLLLPRRWMTTARNVPVTAAGTGTAASAYTYVRESFDLRDGQIEPRDEILATNSIAFQGGPQNLTRDRAILTYFDEHATDSEADGDPKFVLSQPIELPAAPIQTGVGQVQFLHARGGGLKLPDARRIVFFEGFEAP